MAESASESMQEYAWDNILVIRDAQELVHAIDALRDVIMGRADLTMDFGQLGETVEP